jgi:hypothetical protein
MPETRGHLRERGASRGVEQEGFLEGISSRLTEEIEEIL